MPRYGTHYCVYHHLTATVDGTIAFVFAAWYGSGGSARRCLCPIFGAHTTRGTSASKNVRKSVNLSSLVPTLASQKSCCVMCLALHQHCRGYRFSARTRKSIEAHLLILKKFLVARHVGITRQYLGSWVLPDVNDLPTPLPPKGFLFVKVLWAVSPSYGNYTEFPNEVVLYRRESAEPSVGERMPSPVSRCLGIRSSKFCACRWINRLLYKHCCDVLIDTLSSSAPTR